MILDYEYVCEDCHKVTKIRQSVRDATWAMHCSSCGGRAIIRPKCFGVSTFKPYVEDRFTGMPIEITSKGQRDALLKKHHLTYDRYTGPNKARLKPAVDDITFGHVKEALESGKLPDGTPLEKPLKPSEVGEL